MIHLIRLTAICVVALSGTQTFAQVEEKNSINYRGFGCKTNYNVPLSIGTIMLGKEESKYSNYFYGFDLGIEGRMLDIYNYSYEWKSSLFGKIIGGM